MFDKFELPKPIDEFKMPPSKGINRKSHIGKQNFFITVGKLLGIGYIFIGAIPDLGIWLPGSL